MCDLVLDGGFGVFCLIEFGVGFDVSVGRIIVVKDGDEYVLNGRKCFIINGVVVFFYCIIVIIDKEKGLKGILMFFVEKGIKGFSIGNYEDKMGIRIFNICDVVLEDCRILVSVLVGKEGEGFVIVMKILD